MRGKVLQLHFTLVRHGITPAHAGKSSPISEKKRDTAGSPPRMRGKVKFYIGHTALIGITPAHAGKSKGNNHYMGVYEGSPPRMRGKVHQE